MADIYGIGTSALRSIQQAITTTGHNIANVNTEGYSRQRVNMETLPPQFSGAGYIGSGVTVASVERIHSQFIESEIRQYGASANQYQVFHEMSSRINSVLADAGSGLAASLENLFSALQDVANSPSTLPERQVLMGELQNLTARQNSIQGAIGNLNQEVNGRLQLAVADINTLAESIAKLNDTIVTAASSGNSPNDLLDKRDALVRELSTKVGVTVSEQDDGSINLFVGNGNTLVIGAKAQQMTTVVNPYDASRLDIGFNGVAGTSNINNSISGGELQGLLEFRKQVYDPALNKLGVLSLGLTETLNNQHQLGIDLDGNPGGDLFARPTLNVAGNTNNAGTAVPVMSIVDAGQLRADSYQLSFNAGSWQMTRESDGNTVSGAGPLVMDGLSVDVSAGVPVNGDSFLLKPAQDAASQFAQAETDPRKVAAAAALYSGVSVGNTGSLDMDQLQITDNVDLPLAGPVTLTFNPDALGPGVPGFDVTGGITTTVAYDPATDSGGLSFSLGLTGVSFTLSGVPAPGDSATLNNTGPASGDNRNALQLAGMRSTRLLEGGASNYQEVYGGLVSAIGVTTAQAETAMQVEGSLLSQVEGFQSNVAGVNLDEEAANLLRYQQQYQAAAKLISTADLVFQTLLNATGR